MNDAQAGNVTEASTSRTLEVDGITIHYHEAGVGEPLLLLHSWGPWPGVTAWLTWYKILPELATRYRCIAMDIPNYGRTGPIVYHEPWHFVSTRTAVALMDALGLERVNVVGSSTGGSDALMMALKFPDRVKSLVVGSCNAPVLDGGPDLVASFPPEATRVMGKYHESLSEIDLREGLRCLLFDPALVTDELVRSIKETRDAAPSHIDAQRQSRTVPYPDLPRLRDITAPTLYIHGRFDRMVSLEHGLLVLSHIRSSQLVVLNNTGHWPPYEAPVEYLSHVQRFLTTTVGA